MKTGEGKTLGARVLHNTMAQVTLSKPDDRHQALRDTMTELLSMDEPRKRIAGMLSGLDIHYDLGEGHPLLGRRMPDLDVHTTDGPTRVFTLLHDARPVLLNLGEPDGFDISPPRTGGGMIDAEHVGPWELPVLGEIAAPPAVLIRPDGYVETNQPNYLFIHPPLTSARRSSHEAPSAMSWRYSMTGRGRFMPSTPTTRPARP